jgi:hypothetical protein
MEDDDDKLAYLAAGLGAPILLGLLLVPLRGLSTASNFTFAFIVLTIVVAEYGGRWAAVTSALSSALSLDFFLTQPYGRLTIEDKHDVIAFAGLAICGLTAAALGSSRPGGGSGTRDNGADLDLLHLAIHQLEQRGESGPRLSRILEACVDALPLAAAVVRDDRSDIVAASTRAARLRPVPEQRLVAAPSPGSSVIETGRHGARVPRQGVRLELRSGSGPHGWLDVWGNEAMASPQAWRTLADVACVVAVLLADASSRSQAGR